MSRQIWTTVRLAPWFMEWAKDYVGRGGRDGAFLAFMAKCAAEVV